MFRRTPLALILLFAVPLIAQTPAAPPPSEGCVPPLGISCHARAGVSSSGRAPLGVFINEVSEQGYLQSVNGTPVPDWFNASTQPPLLLTLQADFVWGILAASPEVKPGALQATPQRKSPRDAARRD